MAETINERIKRFRKISNLTQFQVAEKLGLKSSTYSQMERKGAISTDMLLSLADIFATNPLELLYPGGSEEFCQKYCPDTYVTNGHLGSLKQALPFKSIPRENPWDTLTLKQQRAIMIIKNFPKEKQNKVTEYINQLYQQK